MTPRTRKPNTQQAVDHLVGSAATYRQAADKFGVSVAALRSSIRHHYGSLEAARAMRGAELARRRREKRKDTPRICIRCKEREVKQAHFRLCGRCRKEISLINDVSV